MKMDAAFPIFNDGSTDKEYDVKTYNSYGNYPDYIDDNSVYYHQLNGKPNYDGINIGNRSYGNIPIISQADYWWLRSPGRDYVISAYVVVPDGSVYHDNFVSWDFCGRRPCFI